MTRIRSAIARLAAVVATAALLPACGKGLSGTYVKCVSINSSSSKMVTFTFPDAANFTYQSVPYSAANCSISPGTPSNSTGSYAIASSSVQGAQNINLVYASGPLSGQTLYQIFKLDGNQLYLGDTTGLNNGQSDATRPTAFETTPYAKQ